MSLREHEHGIGWSIATERYHPTLIQTIKERFPNEHIDIATRAFGNGMPLYLVESGEEKTMLITIINGDNWEEAFSELAMIGSGLTASPDIAGPNTNHLIVLSPFTDGRQDQRSLKPRPDSINDVFITKKQFVFTEALARTLRFVSGCKTFATVDFHSHKGVESFERVGIDFINLTAIRLFADKIAERGYLDDGVETVIGATDIGDLNRVVPMSQYTHLPVAIIHKRSIPNADGTDREIEQRLIYGKVAKRIILVDDIISSGKTFERSFQLYRALGAEEFILFATHPVCVGDYYENLLQVLKFPEVKLILTTNTLPLKDRLSGGISMPYIGTGIHKKSIEVLPVESFLANAADIILHAKDTATAKRLLGHDVWDMQDPYTLLKHITGISVEKPVPSGIYHGEGIFSPLPKEGDIFTHV